MAIIKIHDKLIQTDFIYSISEVKVGYNYGSGFRMPQYHSRPKNVYFEINFLNDKDMIISVELSEFYKDEYWMVENEKLKFELESTFKSINLTEELYEEVLKSIKEKTLKLEILLSELRDKLSLELNNNQSIKELSL